MAIASRITSSLLKVFVNQLGRVYTTVVQAGEREEVGGGRLLGKELVRSQKKQLQTGRLIATKVHGAGKLV